MIIKHLFNHQTCHQKIIKNKVMTKKITVLLFDDRLLTSSTLVILSDTSI